MITKPEEKPLDPPLYESLAEADFANNDVVWHITPRSVLVKDEQGRWVFDSLLFP